MSQAECQRFLPAGTGLSGEEGQGMGGWRGLGLPKLRNKFPAGPRRPACPWHSHPSRPLVPVTALSLQTRSIFQALSEGLIQTKTLAWTLGLLFFNQSFVFTAFFFSFLLCVTFNFVFIFINICFIFYFLFFLVGTRSDCLKSLHLCL